jgi:N-sulfoglucosamine sulfohydrolase
MHTARERHALCRAWGMGYPARAIRTHDFLYIRNYEPDRWPAGDPPLFGDVDAWKLQYASPTKEYLLVHRNDPRVRPLYQLAFGKRPAEELYDLRRDPHPMRNVAAEPAYAQRRQTLATALTGHLRATGDPRETGGKAIWDTVMYYQARDYLARPSRYYIELFGLREEYNYMQPDWSHDEWR